MRKMTTVQQGNTIRFGSAMFEVGETEDELINLGAMNGVAFEEAWDEKTINSDNAGPIFIGISNHTAVLKGDLLEINLKNLAMLRGGLDKYEEVTATEGKKAAIRLLSGGMTSFKPRIVKVTNFNEKGEKFSISVFKATTAVGIAIEFPAADADDAASVPIEMKGVIDTDRELGEQLFEIYDEQGVEITP